MSDLDRLHEEEVVVVVDETSARILAAEAEHGQNISHEELTQRLGL